MSTIPLKQQNRELVKQLEKARVDIEIFDRKLKQSELSYQQLQRSVNAFHIRLEALKMAGNCKYMLSSDPINDIKSLAIQFEKWLIEGFEPVEKTEEPIIDKPEEQ